MALTYCPEVKDDGLGVVYGIVVGLTGDGFTLAERCPGPPR